MFKYIVAALCALAVHASVTDFQTRVPTLRIAPVVWQQVVTNYDAFPDQEQAYCLYGTIGETEASISGLLFADVLSTTPNTVVLRKKCADEVVPMPAPMRYLGTLHTHHTEVAVANPAVPALMRKPEEAGIACSHFVVFPSGEVSRIPTSDYVEFAKDTTAALSLIYCGDRLVWIGRDGIEYMAMDRTK